MQWELVSVILCIDELYRSDLLEHRCAASASSKSLDVLSEHKAGLLVAITTVGQALRVQSGDDHDALHDFRFDVFQRERIRSSNSCRSGASGSERGTAARCARALDHEATVEPTVLQRLGCQCSNDDIGEQSRIDRSLDPIAPRSTTQSRRSQHAGEPHSQRCEQSRRRLLGACPEQGAPRTEEHLSRAGTRNRSAPDVGSCAHAAR